MRTDDREPISTDCSKSHALPMHFLDNAEIDSRGDFHCEKCHHEWEAPPWDHCPSCGHDGEEEFDADKEIGPPTSNVDKIDENEQPKPGWRPADK